ncbi:MAG TPA: hypothetical protein VLZ07_12090 [Syntrophales bacterium]|nr:hypothetical protein [Syntrophales bacterium]
MKVNDLLQHAPAFNRWVDDLLARHESSARQVTAYGFRRLSQFFSPETIEAARCVEVDSVPKIPWQEFGLPVPKGMDVDFEGITFRNTYFLRRKEANQESLHFHEMVHVVQWQMLGNDLFPLIYVLDALKGSYQTNILEVITREVTDFFVKAEEPFNAEFIIAAWIGQNLPPIFTQFIKGEL